MVIIIIASIFECSLYSYLIYIISFNFTTIVRNRYNFYDYFMGKKTKQRLSNFPKATQLIGGRFEYLTLKPVF